MAKGCAAFTDTGEKITPFILCSDCILKNDTKCLVRKQGDGYHIVDTTDWSERFDVSTVRRVCGLCHYMNQHDTEYICKKGRTIYKWYQDVCDDFKVSKKLSPVQPSGKILKCCVCGFESGSLFEFQEHSEYCEGCGEILYD